MSDETPTKGEAQREIGWDIDFAMGGGNRGFIPELRMPHGLVQLKKMADTDETVGAMLWVMATTIGQIPFSYTPCIDGKEVATEDPDYDEAADYADFAQSCLDDMEHSWSDHLEEALTMAWAGFAPCEITFKKRDGIESKFDDGRWGFRGMPLRDQFSVWDWKSNDRNEVVAMLQRTTDGKTGDIPLWKLLHYRMSRVLNDPWGKSMLTNAYEPWFLKRRIQQSEAIGIDRELAGLPTFLVPQAELNAAAEVGNDGKPTPKALAAKRRLQAAMDAVTKMRFNEVGGIVMPSDPFEDEDGKPGTIRKWDFKITSSAGQRSIDARTAARDYDRAIARTVLMQFLHLGERSGGSYGLSEDQSSMAVKSMKWVAQKIVDEHNLKAIPLLWMMNALPKRFMPKLGFGNLSEEGLVALSNFLESMATADVVFRDDPALKDVVLDRAGLKTPRRRIRDVAAKKPRVTSPQHDDLFPAPKPAPAAGGATKPPATKKPAATKK